MSAPAFPTLHLFAGPSLFDTPFHDEAAARQQPGITWHAPARRGDIEALLAAHPGPGALALADGTFHAYPSVRHIELRDALEAGWQVWGLCSMGAIRACEMQHLGMKPWGQVAEAFCARPETPDDEVALVHGAGHPWLPLSEPMVHLREFLACMQAEGHLGADVAAAVAHALRERWYGERTLAALRGLLAERVDAAALARLDAQLADFSRFRLKQRDLQQFIERRPWLA